MDWENAYRQEGRFTGPPPWNIGEPQPELIAALRTDGVRDDVLDAGCGHAELSLMLAAEGHTSVGIDIAPTAIAAATAAAAERGLTTAAFVCDDITAFTGYDGRFATIADSTLFHSLPIEGRDGYLRSIHRAAAPGAKYYVLAFARGAFPPGLDTAPNEVSEAELRSAVSEYFVVDDVRPAWIHTNTPEMPGMPAEFAPRFAKDEYGRIQMPAFLLTAQKA